MARMYPARGRVYHGQADSDSVADLDEVNGENPWFPFHSWVSTIKNRSSMNVTVAWVDVKHSIRDIDFNLGLTGAAAPTVGVTYEPETTLSMEHTLLHPGSFITLPVHTRVTLLQGDCRPVSKGHVPDASTSSSMSSSSSSSHSSGASSSTTSSSHSSGMSSSTSSATSSSASALSSSSTSSTSSGSNISLGLLIDPPAPVPGDGQGGWWMDQKNYICISHYLHKPLVLTDAGDSGSTGVLLWQQHDPHATNPHDSIHWGCSANPKGSYSLNSHHWIVNDSPLDVFVIVSTESISLESVKFLFGVSTANAVQVKAELHLTTSPPTIACPVTAL